MAKKIITIGKQGIRERIEGSGPVNSYSFENLQVNSPYTVGELPEDRFNTIQEAINQWDADKQPSWPIIVRPKISYSGLGEPLPRQGYYEEDLVIPPPTRESGDGVWIAALPLSIDSKNWNFTKYLTPRLKGTITLEGNAERTKNGVFMENIYITGDGGSVFETSNLGSAFCIFKDCYLKGTYFVESLNFNDMQVAFYNCYVSLTEPFCSSTDTGVIIDYCENSTLSSSGDALFNIDTPNQYLTLRANNSNFTGRIFGHQRIRNDNILELKNCYLYSSEMSVDQSHIDLRNGGVYLENCRIKSKGADSNHTVITADEDIFWTGIVENENFANSLLVDAPSSIDFNYNLSIGVSGAEELSTGVNVTPLNITATIT